MDDLAQLATDGVVAGSEVEPWAGLARTPTGVPAEHAIRVGALHKPVERAARRHVPERRRRWRVGCPAFGVDHHLAQLAAGGVGVGAEVEARAGLAGSTTVVAADH